MQVRRKKPLNYDEMTDLEKLKFVLVDYINNYVLEGDDYIPSNAFDERFKNQHSIYLGGYKTVEGAIVKSYLDLVYKQEKTYIGDTLIATSDFRTYERMLEEFEGVMNQEKIYYTALNEEGYKNGLLSERQKTKVQEKEINKEEDGQIYLGFSDYASLIAVGCGEKGVISEFIDFGEDNDYYASVLDGDDKVPDWFKKVWECEYWLKIYDDTTLRFSQRAKKFEIYRSGDTDIIIKKYNK